MKQPSLNQSGALPAPETTAPQAPADKQALQQHLMDSLDVMQLLHICRGTLYNWRKLGLIAYSKVGGRIYFEVADVYRMLKEQKKQGWHSPA